MSALRATVDGSNGQRYSYAIGMPDLASIAQRRIPDRPGPRITLTTKYSYFVTVESRYTMGSLARSSPVECCCPPRFYPNGTSSKYQHEDQLELGPQAPCLITDAYLQPDSPDAVTAFRRIKVSEILSLIVQRHHMPCANVQSRQPALVQSLQHLQVRAQSNLNTVLPAASMASYLIFNILPLRGARLRANLGVVVHQVPQDHRTALQYASQPSTHALREVLGR
ncbi:hypothetical protein M440DRAFT_1461164 [Trichoderma longibrachiatum ATCC 18648]|uniref:Uncharacterized protein n=1 Tax=Trichoderma longibrachiatum ATCC 18648 TaxID=983965 RepID=A0A2T4CDU1_TRILO|nr:hypothetical protein M440DRAFT_1461164 [Trichoderma longibrachiatum ATCC 18648]